MASAKAPEKVGDDADESTLTSAAMLELQRDDGRVDEQRETDHLHGVGVGRVLIARCLAFLAWLGEADTARLASEDLGLDSESSWAIAPRGINRRWSAYREANVSWLWFLLPIILTTAFVIYGAWRRSVWDAEVDEVSDDE